MIWGVSFSLVYVVCVIGVPFLFNLKPNGLNEWGDFLTGFLSPLALAWFVATLYLQRSELGLQRKELEFSREEMRLSREAQEVQSRQQERAANAYLEANLIAAKNSFADRIQQFHMIFDQFLSEIGQGFPSQVQTLSHGSVRVSRPELAHAYQRYFDALEEVSFDSSTIPLTPSTERRITEFLSFYEEFMINAAETKNTIYTSGKYRDAYEALREFRSGRQA